MAFNNMLTSKEFDDDFKMDCCSPDMFEDIPDEFVTVSSDSEMIGELSGKNSKLKSDPMTEIHRSNSPWSAPEFPLVSHSYNHAVLYHIPRSTGVIPFDKPPVPQKGKDLWDKDHVRMPHSPESFYPVEQENGDQILKQRWDVITEALSQPIKNSHELEAAILKYNTRYKGLWKFTSMHVLFNKYLDEEETEYFFKSTLPAMIELALKLPKLVCSPIPLLRQCSNRSVSLSQEQTSCLLANAFFCTFPRRNSNRYQHQKNEYSNFPDINFNRLFQCKSSRSILEKLKCICNYFRRVCKNVPCGVLTFTRRHVEINKCPEWHKSKLFVGSVPSHITSEGTIENDGAGLLQVDFANKYLGGGVLGQGCVQEEIRFVICPELLISMLFTEVMKPTEALLMIGCEQFSEYTGYADKFMWSGNYEDKTPLDSSGRRRCAIVAIDAIPFGSPEHQYKPEFIARDLCKAWIAFSIYSDCNSIGLTLPGVATGNWGCGAFRGSPHLKALLQLMSCCEARRPMVYYTFGDMKLRDDIINMYKFLSRENVTIGALYKCLCQFHKTSLSGKDLYSYILQYQKDTTNSPITSRLKKTLCMFKSTKEQIKDEKTKDANSKIINQKDFESMNTGIVESVSNEPSVSGRDQNVSSPETKRPTSSLAEKNTTITQSVLCSSMFDQFVQSDKISDVVASSSQKGVITKRVGNLSFFEKMEGSPEKSREQMDSPECNRNQEEKSIEDLNDNKIPCNNTKSTPRNSSGKISDYFQRIPKITK